MKSFIHIPDKKIIFMTFILLSGLNLHCQVFKIKEVDLSTASTSDTDKTALTETFKTSMSLLDQSIDIKANINFNLKNLYYTDFLTSLYSTDNLNTAWELYLSRTNTYLPYNMIVSLGTLSDTAFLSLAKRPLNSSLSQSAVKIPSSSYQNQQNIRLYACLKSRKAYLPDLTLFTDQKDTLAADTEFKIKDLRMGFSFITLKSQYIDEASWFYKTMYFISYTPVTLLSYITYDNKKLYIETVQSVTENPHGGFHPWIRLKNEINIKNFTISSILFFSDVNAVNSLASYIKIPFFISISPKFSIKNEHVKFSFCTLYSIKETFDSIRFIDPYLIHTAQLFLELTLRSITLSSSSKVCYTSSSDTFTMQELMKVKIHTAHLHSDISIRYKKDLSSSTYTAAFDIRDFSQAIDNINITTAFRVKDSLLYSISPYAYIKFDTELFNVNLSLKVIFKDTFFINDKE